VTCRAGAWSGWGSRSQPRWTELPRRAETLATGAGVATRLL